MAKICYCNVYIVCTGSNRPTLKDLNHHVVKQAAHRWRNLGEELLDDYQFEIIMLDIVMKAHHPDDDTRCFMVLDGWLETTPYPSWNQLIRALRRPTVQLDSLADQLEKMLDIKCKIYSNSYSLLQTVHYEYCGLSNHDVLPPHFAILLPPAQLGVLIASICTTPALILTCFQAIFVSTIILKVLC